MAMKDVRDYIAALEKEGELQRVEKEVDWDLEMGGIIRRVYDLKAPAPLFQKIKGYSKEYSVLGAPLGASKKPNRFFVRLAISLGMKPDSSAEDIMEGYIKKVKNPIKPVLVSTGPCKENIQLGDEIDIEKFPTPLLHGGDGGRYIGTWHIVITKDPDTGWVNWGTYRMMLHDKKSTGLRINRYQDIGLIYYPKYLARNRPMEVAMVMGAEQASTIAACSKFEPGVNEVDIAGGITGQPVELVKCETIDLAVPASAEIVLEGTVTPGDLMDEGPFGEFTGYMAGERAPRPVFRVKAVTHRNNPIMPVASPGVPVEENQVLRPLMAASLLEYLRSQGFPIRMVYISPLVGTFMYMISSQVPFAHYAKHLAGAVWGCPWGRVAHFLVVTDEDVDVTNLDEVVWALTTRCHPDRGIVKMPTVGGGLTPFLSMYEKRYNLGASVLFDCTWPKDWPPEAIPVKASFDVLWPKDVQEKVLKNWKEYGYKA